MKGPRACEPFIGHNAQRVLVAGRDWMPSYLLGGHVGNRRSILRALKTHPLLQNRNAKISEQQLPPRVQQHILWFDIAVDDALVIGMLQGAGRLLDKGKNRRWRYRDLLRKTSAKAAALGVWHHQVRHAALHAKVQQTSNVRMRKQPQQLGFSTEEFDVLTSQVRVEDFNDCLCARLHVFSQIDLGKTPPVEHPE